MLFCFHYDAATGRYAPVATTDVAWRGDDNCCDGDRFGARLAASSKKWHGTPLAQSSRPVGTEVSNYRCRNGLPRRLWEACHDSAFRRYQSVPFFPKPTSTTAGSKSTTCSTSSSSCRSCFSRSSSARWRCFSGSTENAPASVRSLLPRTTTGSRSVGLFAWVISWRDLLLGLHRLP